MLYSAKLIFADQRRVLELESNIGSTGENIDYSLLLDGLDAEREQGITIDVAYRYFSTNKRSFIVADTPGHEEYTRNMAVGASFAELATILIDAEKGVLIQTRRHTRICALMGIHDFIFAINKMDLVGYSEARFKDIQQQIDELTSSIESEQGCKFHSVKVIPVSATCGDNLNSLSENMKWYFGETLLEYLESINIEKTDAESATFIMPVQRVSRPDHTFRGFQGEIISGILRTGDEITVLPSRQKAYVSRVIAKGKDVNMARTGEPAVICLNREVDISRGCVITSGETSLHIGSSMAVNLLWMDDNPLKEGVSYRVQIGTESTFGIIKKIRYLIDIDTGTHIRSRTIKKNDLALCKVELGT